MAGLRHVRTQILNQQLLKTSFATSNKRNYSIKTRPKANVPYVLLEATREEMSAARLPLAYRDSCAHLLIPLNKCRTEQWYLPWRCEVCSFFVTKRWVQLDVVPEDRY